MTFHEAGKVAESSYFRLTEAADGVYAAIADPSAGALGNAAIIDLGDTTLVVDTTMNLEAARDLRRAAERLTGRKVDYVFNTHWHGDHTYGNQVFEPEAKFVSTRKTRDIIGGFLKDRMVQHLERREELLAELDEYEKNIVNEKDVKVHQELKWDVDGDREYLRVLGDMRVVVPTLTFEREMWIHGSKRSAQLLTFGGGHTQSDGILYLADEKLAVLGDLVLSGYHPTMGNADPWTWLTILDQIEALGIDTIVPGHGDICRIDTLHQVREYIAYMLALAADLDLADEQMEGVSIPERYDDWLFRYVFKSNLRKIRELSVSKTAK